MHRGGSVIREGCVGCHVFALSRLGGVHPTHRTQRPTEAALRDSIRLRGFFRFGVDMPELVQGVILGITEVAELVEFVAVVAVVLVVEILMLLAGGTEDEFLGAVVPPAGLMMNLHRVRNGLESFLCDHEQPMDAHAMGTMLDPLILGGYELWEPVGVEVVQRHEVELEEIVDNLGGRAVKDLRESMNAVSVVVEPLNLLRGASDSAPDRGLFRVRRIHIDVS